MKQNSRGVVIIAVLIPILLLALGAVGYFVYQNSQLRKTTDPQNTTTITPQPSPIPTINPTVGWETYTSPMREYSFKHPPDLSSDTEVGGSGIESIRFIFMGEKQGKKNGSLIDGYAFIVIKSGSGKQLDAKEQADQYWKAAGNTCPNPDIVNKTELSEVTIGNRKAWQYSLENCMGNYTTIYVSNDKNVFWLTQLYTEDNEKAYRQVTNQILSTFEFTDS